MGIARSAKDVVKRQRVSRDRYCLRLSTLVLLGSIGCKVGQVAPAAAFASDFGCSDNADAETIGYERYRVTGCGMSADYDCSEGMTCTLISPGEPAKVVQREAPRPRPPSPDRIGRSRVTVSDGRKPVELEIQLAGALLKLSTEPSRGHGIVRLKLSYATDIDDKRSCDLEWLLNGERIVGPKSKFVRGIQLSSHSVILPSEFAETLAAVKKLGVKSCERHWALLPRQLGEMQGFLEMAADEAAWDKAPRAGSPAALVAPTGGWPAWTGFGSAPVPAKQIQALEGTTLFKSIAPSVFQVEALAGLRSAQGSAVAVSPTEVLTNCHVVEGAHKIIIKRDNKEWVAPLLRSDPDSDRCVLSVPDASFQPVAGVRPFASLEVGETVYTLGSPNGFELSLASGVLSGRREEHGRKFVQTTAPISPGSSGGGLFDARGNLIGITTLIVVGRDRVNQALNFAISADSFWQP